MGRVWGVSNTLEVMVFYVRARYVPRLFLKIKSRIFVGCGPNSSYKFYSSSKSGRLIQRP